MNSSALRLFGVSALLVSVAVAPGDVKVTVDHNETANASSSFKFRSVPSPSKDDAGAKAKFAFVDGERDENGGFLTQLQDGRVPTEADQPSENFFFNAGTAGGRFSVDLGSETELTQVNTYSWHPNARGPQVYKLYGSAGTAGDFKSSPKLGTNPEQAGWKLIATVDTRPKGAEGGGQYGVSISDSAGSLGKFRYLLFDCARTESDDAFGNTFYSEVDVVTGPAPAFTPEIAAAPAGPFLIKSVDGKCEIAIDTSKAPELKEWAEQKLAPVLAEWYPKIVALLPSEGYTAPTSYSVAFLPPGPGVTGVAATGGTRVTANAGWISRELNREAIGAILHEEVHVVQQYGWARRNNPNATRAPGWLTEAIPDYIRWFLFEPQSHGADIVWIKRQRNFTPKYDTAYRPGANFLNWVTEKYAKDLVTKLNAAIRSGKYTEEIWKEITGKTAPELGEEWKTYVMAQLAAPAETAAAASSPSNTLTEAEKAAGWKLLFDGKTLDGWHNYKREGIRPGWQVKDGAVVCVDPHDAGDIVTREKFGAFEFQLEYNISEAGNSGIIYHVSDEGSAVWQSGPEVQLEDNVKAADPQRCGWLYGLYQPPNDPNSGKPLDATKPVGEWNHIRLVISPEKCEHYVNGVKYFEYVIGSEDFQQRVAKSKFGRMRGFAKSETGYLALQGDHGQVSFRNIKIREIPAKR